MTFTEMPALLEILAWNALEATMLATAIAFAGRLFKLGAPLRHTLWLLVLAKLMFPPLVPASFGLGGACVRLWSLLSPQAPSEGERTGGKGGVVFEEELDEEASLPVASPSRPPEVSPSHGFLYLFQGALYASWWMGGLAAAFLEAMRIARFRRRLRLAEAAPPEIAQECKSIARRLGLAHVPPVKVVEEDLSPLVWAFGRPVVFISRSVADESNPEVLRSLLAHELAHIRRRDHWISWVELLGGMLFWWLPTFWWARRQIRSAADQAADSWAVSVVGSREVYAESLFKIVQMVSARPHVLPTLGQSLGQREVIARRLVMILRGKVSHRLSFASKACVALLGLFVLPASPAGGLAQSTDEPSAARAKPATAAVQAKPAAPADPAQAGRPSPEARLDQLETNFQRILAELSALRASLETSRSEGAVTAPAGSARAGRAWVQAVAPPAALPKATTLPQVPGVPYGARPDKVQLRQGYWSPKTIQPETIQPVEVEAASADSLDSLSPEQRDELKRLDDDFQRDMDELRQRMKEISRQHQKALEKVLTPEQRQELKARRALPMSRRPAKIRETEKIEVSK